MRSFAGAFLTRTTVIPAVVLALVAIIFIALFSNSPARASVYIVTTTADSFDPSCGGSDCSLRGALSVAEDGDIISIPPGTYTLTTGRTLTISVDVEILGEGIGETVIQAATHPSVAEVGVFTIEAGATVIFRDVEIRNGNSSLNGGGINTTGTVTVKDSWIHDNWAQSAGGGIWSRGGFFW